MLTSEQLTEHAQNQLKLDFDGFERELQCFLLWAGTESYMLECFNSSMSHSFILFAEHFMLREPRWTELMSWVQIDLTRRDPHKELTEKLFTRFNISFGTLQRLVSIQVVKPDMSGVIEAVLNWLDETSCKSLEQVEKMQSSADFFKARRLLTQLKDWIPQNLRDFTNLVRNYRYASSAFEFSEILPILKRDIDTLTPRPRLLR
jgi:hypothetical protein